MSESSLVIFTRASAMLAEADTIQKAKELKSLSLTAADWLKRKGMGEEAIQYARSYAFDAERRMGELLEATERAKAGRPAKNTSPVSRDSEPTLADLGISYNESSKAQELADLPREVFDQVKSGKITRKAATKAAKKKKKADKKAAVPKDFPKPDDRYRLIEGDLATADMKPNSVDWIITDPPYPAKFLPVYAKLSAFADKVLKPGGSLLAMVGQSYLPDILAGMSERMKYQWTLAYLTPGGQAVQLWDRKVNTFWKPVLWFVKGKYTGDWIGDVSRSDVNDNDKNHHHWGQSESGMADLVERFTFPGQTICDPFLGGGTTGVVAVKMNRLFVGIDIDPACVASSRERMAKSCRK